MNIEVRNPTPEIALHGGEVWVSLVSPPAGVPALNGVRAQNRAQGLTVPQVFSGPQNPGDDFYIEDHWGESASLVGWWFDPVMGEAQKQLTSPPFTLEKDATYTWDMAKNTVVAKKSGLIWFLMAGAALLLLAFVLTRGKK